MSPASHRQSLRRIFKQFAQDSVRDFSKLHNRLIIQDAATGDFEASFDVSKVSAVEKIFIESALKTLRAQAKENNHSHAFYNDLLDLNVITFHTSVPVFLIV